LQHVLSRLADSSKARQTLLAQAYADFFRGTANLAYAGPSGERATAEARGLAITVVTDARARLAIYGSDATLRALAAFSEDGNLGGPTGQRIFVEVCRETGRGVGRKAIGLENELAIALLGPSSASEKRLPVRLVGTETWSPTAPNCPRKSRCIQLALSWRRVLTNSAWPYGAAS
jgi:hypothetical protein